MDNDILRTPSLDSFGQTTVNIHAPTVEQLDLHDRDPTDMNKHVRVSEKHYCVLQSKLVLKFPWVALPLTLRLCSKSAIVAFSLTR